MTRLMHPNQITTSADLVRRLLQSQYPVLANEPISVSPLGGTDNSNYRIGSCHIARLPIIDWAAGKQERNRHLMPRIIEATSLMIPSAEFFGRPEFGYPYSWTVLPWIEGTPYKHGCDDPQVAIDLARFIHDLQAISIDDAPPTGRDAHDMDAEVRRNLALLTATERRDDLHLIWREMMVQPRWDGSNAVWIHGDLAPGNLLLLDGHLSAVIDWSEPGQGDSANDMIIAWNMFTPRTRAIFRKALDADDATWDRARARAFAQAALALPYYRDSFPKLAEQARYTFNQILTDIGNA